MTDQNANVETNIADRLHAGLMDGEKYAGGVWNRIVQVARKLQSFVSSSTSTAEDKLRPVVDSAKDKLHSVTANNAESGPIRTTTTSSTLIGRKQNVPVTTETGTKSSAANRPSTAPSAGAGHAQSFGSREFSFAGLKMKYSTGILSALLLAGLGYLLYTYYATGELSCASLKRRLLGINDDDNTNNTNNDCCESAPGAKRKQTIVVSDTNTGERVVCEM